LRNKINLQKIKNIDGKKKKKGPHYIKKMKKSICFFSKKRKRKGRQEKETPPEPHCIFSTAMRSSTAKLMVCLFKRHSERWCLTTGRGRTHLQKCHAPPIIFFLLKYIFYISKGLVAFHSN